MTAFRVLALILGLVWLTACGAPGRARPINMDTARGLPGVTLTPLATKLVCHDKGGGKKVCKTKVIGSW